MSDVLVTGASRGIGLGLVREYLARGARVFAACREPDSASDLHALAHQHLNQHQNQHQDQHQHQHPPADRLVPVRLDVTDPEQVAAAALAVAARTDGLDVLVNNAGIFHASPGLADVDPVRMVDSFRVNALGPLLVGRAFLPLLQARPAGSRLVNITMPTRPIERLSTSTDHAYFASRYALNALTKMMSVELAGGPVVTVALYPGYLRTDMNDNSPEATPVETGAPALVSLIDGLTPADNGACLLPDGTRFDW
jgi:NAD(P)-dependent dehydrogenase (short-subunit alcohol dehydrogenase family)